MNSNTLLDALKTQLGVPSDYALARNVLKVDPMSLRDMRERGLSDKRAVQIATLLNLDPAQVLAWVHAERAQDPQVRKIWEKLAKSLVASLVALALWGVFAPQPAHASNVHTIYIMRSARCDVCLMRRLNYRLLCALGACTCCMMPLLW